jgi:uracil phosphoribosyltransferase
MKNVTIITHPLVEHSMAILRDKNTPNDEFRRHGDIVAKFLISEATSDLQTEPVDIATPIGPTTAQTLKSRVVVVPILRAGLSLLPAAQELLPHMAVGFVGLVRDEQTAIADKYYEKLPDIKADDLVLIVDPMLATGGSMDEAINIVKKAGGKKIKAVNLLASPEGVERIHSKHPDVEIVTTVVDDGLDDRKYIVPGLGDFGDRYFATD